MSLKWNQQGEVGHTHVGESTGRQAHSDGAHQGAGHDQQIGVGVIHADANLSDKGEHDEGGYGVGDECGHDQDQAGKYDQDPV